LSVFGVFPGVKNGTFQHV